MSKGLKAEEDCAGYFHTVSREQEDLSAPGSRLG